jgi:hypothetical protein
MIVAAVLSAWVQYAADGKPHARALVTKSCPSLHVDGATIAMTRRAGTDVAHGFTEAVCDAPVPRSAVHVGISGRPLPAPPQHVNTIVVFGDTGCRMKGGEQQNCGDPENWPFPRIAQQIAAVHADIAIHVGDYYYRENNCATPIPGCVNYWGDTSASWNADWFHPAAPIFASVPLVLTRGNHEDCRRGGPGWYRFLEPSAAAACPDPVDANDGTMPYAISLDRLRLIMLDSASDVSDSAVDPVRAAYYQRAYGAVPALARGGPSSTWLVTHRPPYANADMASVLHATPADLGAIATVLAGHVHDFATVNLDGYPPLIVNGEGGDDLDDLDDTQEFIAGQHFALRDPAPFAAKQFGFAVYTRSGDSWTISLRDPEGIEREVCRLGPGPGAAAARAVVVCV